MFADKKGSIPKGLFRKSAMSYGSGQERVQLAMPNPVKLFTPGVIVLLVLTVIGFILRARAESWSANWLALTPAFVLRGRLWQLVTYPFLESTCSVFWHGIITLFCASAIEREWRTRSVLVLWLLVSVTCGIVWTIACLVFGRGNAAWAGGHGCAYGLIGAFGLVFRKRRFLVFFWTMEAQVFALLLIGVGLVIGIAHPMFPLVWVWVGGAGVAYLYIKFLWQRGAGGGGGGRSRRSARDMGRFAEID